MNEPNDPEALRRDREQARQELGETVAELTDKLDVPARAKDKVHDAADAAKDRVTDAKYQALAAADQARDKAEQVQAVAKEKTRHAAEKVESSVPEPVTERGKQAAEVARRNPIPVAAAAISATALIWWLARRWRS
ncbi:DUF3618 domain-containing protein [Nocardia salmonicida]|uniref:DUF3618 domain-containing protein n=1 Tax=Nocardia salmonicida TaxID=53431 RepID=UPI002E2A268A|nr:DUF3618 domain-containing protein [Nocardia salmonicida]